MSGLHAITCRACGGAVALRTGERLPACLFCGSAALEEAQSIERIEPPEVFLSFEVDADAADAAFRTFARSSFWYPSDIRHARLKLEPILLPAWIWSASVDAHFTGLQRASTSSGKRPWTASEVVSLSGVLVPSSSAVTRGELAAISPYDASRREPFDAERAPCPYELGRLSRQASLHQAESGMEAMLVRRMSAEHGAFGVKGACLFTELKGEPLLLPVYVGAYRRGDRLYRIVINGQSGELTGDAPTSWWKVLGVVFAVGFLLFGLVLMLVLCAGGAGIASNL